jgi:hypothetical protein
MKTKIRDNPRNLFTERKAPVLVLDKDATLAFIHENSGDFYQHPDRFAIRSNYLCDFLDELGESGFVYNLQAQRAFEKAHDIPEMAESGSVLSLLIYNAQGYRRGDAKVAAGWHPGNGDLLEEAHRTGSKIEVCGENALGFPAQEAFNVREIDGKLYAMRPRKRKYACNISGKPCRLVLA